MVFEETARGYDPLGGFQAAYPDKLRSWFKARRDGPKAYAAWRAQHLPWVLSWSGREQIRTHPGLTQGLTYKSVNAWLEKYENG
jgi:hypothetical protein